MANNPERDWKKWGAENPFFGVLSQPKFLNENLNEQSLQEFFDSGAVDVGNVFSVIESKIRPGFRPNRVLDFGCGVGRLVIPFARHAQTVLGIDISPGMLAEAEKNCKKRNLQGITLLNASEIDTVEKGSFDLVHSFIVFQHIPTAAGEPLLRKLISLIAPGGMGAIHFTFSDVRPTLRRTTFAVRSRSRLMHGIFNVIQRKPFSTPFMQMNSYSMNRLFNILIDSRCSNLHLAFTDHGGVRGAMLYFEKQAK